MHGQGHGRHLCGMGVDSFGLVIIAQFFGILGCEATLPHRGDALGRIKAILHQHFQCLVPLKARGDAEETVHGFEFTDQLLRVFYSNKGTRILIQKFVNLFLAEFEIRIIIKESDQVLFVAGKFIVVFKSMGNHGCRKGILYHSNNRMSVVVCLFFHIFSGHIGRKAMIFHHVFPVVKLKLGKMPGNGDSIQLF